jgi:ABC-type multidrug transport system fused ATPase/permease subunit
LTVIDNDKVIVLEKGRVVEIGHPFELLVENEGDGEITSKGEFARMIKANGDIA